MNERRQKLEAVFHAAMDLVSPGERERYLSKACAGDTELRREVDELLKSAAAAESVFQAGREACHVSEAIPAVTLAEKPGDHIGRYKMLEKIGEGGMGVVYMAEQEEPVRRKVALKIIKLGMDTRQVVARFEAERQALAMMDHPHIARVLDAGATETGRPYFVMELVQGIPITEFCLADQLSLAERLKLFILVCQAIQSAHQKGIIHRDLKPTNVLVTLHNGSPHPMVIDFGVAKAIDQKLTEKTLFTNFATMIGTPAYMSPEQAEMSKLDVDTRSDIYSLGVLLYELLTGTPPFPEERLRSVAYAEMQRIIAEEEPERPSTRLKKKRATASSPALRTPLGERDGVRGTSDIDSDLDWIVMKCLEKDRNRRYETANGLATDLNRHLTNEPVVARPPSAAYRLRKTIRRHRLAFVAGGAVALALIGGIAATSWQAVRATRAEASAKAEATKSRQAEQTSHEEAIKATKAEQKATEQAESAQAIKQFLLENIAGNNLVELDAASYEISIALVKRIARQMEGRFTNQPLIQAEIRQALMAGLMSARDLRGGVEQAELLLNLQRRLLPPYHSNIVVTIMMLANARYQLGQREEGMRLLTDSMNSIRALDPPNTNGALASVGGAYGLLLFEEGRTDEALLYLREALATARGFKTNGSAAIIWTAALADSLEGVDLLESERLWREGLELCLQNPNFGPSHRRTLDNQFGIGRVLVRQKKTDEALSALPPVIASFETRFGSNYYGTVRAQAWLALALDQKGDTAAVTRLYADMYPRLMKSMHHAHARYSFEEMAEFFVRERNYAQAKLAYDALRQIYESVSPKNGFEWDWFVRATAATKGWPAAAELCRKEFDRFAKPGTACRIMGTVFLYVGDDAWYRKTTTKAIALSATTTNWEGRLAILHIAARGPFTFSAEQRDLCRALVQSVERAMAGVAPGEQTRAHRAIGAMQLRLGELTNGLAHLEQALQAEKGPASRARTLLIKALCLQKLDRAEAARVAFAEGEGILKPLLFDRVIEFEGFLTDSDRYDILLHREVRALLGAK